MEKDISFRPKHVFKTACPRGIYSLGCFSASAGALDMLSGNGSGQLELWDAEQCSNASKMTWDLKRGKILDICVPNALNFAAVGVEWGDIVGIDRRYPNPAWNLPMLPSYGCPFRLLLDSQSPYWMISGSNRGYLTVWDLRFRLPVKTWRYPKGAQIEALAYASPKTLGLASEAPVIFCAAGDEEISGWDVSTGECKVVLSYSAASNEITYNETMAQPNIVPKIPSDPIGRARQLGAAELRSLSTKRSSVRCILSSTAGILTAGVDRTVRHWDYQHEKQSYIVAPPHVPEDSYSSTTYSYSKHHHKTGYLIKEHREISRDCQVENQSKLITRVCHKQTITSMTRVQGLQDQLLASTSSDGVLNVWR